MRIGVDLGGTKIEIIALDSGGEAVVRSRIASPSNDYAAVVEAVGSLVERVEKRVAMGSGAHNSVGIGMPGMPSQATGLVRNANSVVLNGKPFRQDISKRLGRDVRVENDANCFALSEARDGAGAGSACVFGAILGTGVGAGIVVRGRLLRGVNGVAGEWGHSPLPWLQADEIPGPPCYCGKRGCVETFLSGPGLARDYAAAAGNALDARAVVASARAGDPRAKAALDRYLDRLARALATVVNLLDPDAIVLGGGLSNMAEIYEQVPRRMLDYVFSDTLLGRIVPPAHGDSSGVRGAAWLWPAV